ncbi:MAG: hypothetical protein SGJ19_07660 [Planctomycetia bacterium]|nr:hypothetical protein [Planctomycetia bacterium]
MRREPLLPLTLLLALWLATGCAKNRQATVATHGSDQAAVCTSG